jgi:hypothetical protein
MPDIATRKGKAGNPNEIGDQLKNLGPVTPIDITIPPPPGAAAQHPAPASK